MSNAAQFHNETRAILVGEPPGETPNSYQEKETFWLPASHQPFQGRGRVGPSAPYRTV